MVSDSAKAAALERMKAVDDFLAQTGEAMNESRLRSTEPTPEQKNAVASGVANPLAYEAKKSTQATDIRRGNAAHA
jgi:hypothetical protein